MEVEAADGHKWGAKSPSFHGYAEGQEPVSWKSRSPSFAPCGCLPGNDPEQEIEKSFHESHDQEPNNAETSAIHETETAVHEQRGYRL
jgi:hypothetical protein